MVARQPAQRAGERRTGPPWWDSLPQPGRDAHSGRCPVIEPTDEMIADARDASAALTGHCSTYLETKASIRAVLAIVAREHVILPRGAQALCCDDHPEAVIRWGECPVCVAEMPPEERT